MTENDISQYKYDAMSNKVEAQDRRSINRNEPTGDPTTLVGKLSASEMGSRAAKSQPPTRQKDQPETRKSTQRRSVKRQPHGGISSLQAYSYNYNPSTPDTIAIFDNIMAWAQELLEDVSHEVLRDAVDEVLVVAHSERLDHDKKKQTEQIIGSKLSDEKFNQLLNLSKRLTDFKDNEGEATEAATGVAVELDEDEDEDEEMEQDDDDDLEDQDQDDSESDDGEDQEFGAEPLPDTTTEVIDPQNQHKTQTDYEVAALEIDAFWLQRTMKPVSTDSHALQDLSEKVFEILASDMSLGQAENEIMELFDFDHVEIVKKLCRNRQKIVWLTRLAQAGSSTADRQQIETDMKNSGADWILRELRGVDLEETNGDAMDVDQQDQEDLTGKYVPKEIDLNVMTVEDSGNNNLLGSVGVKLPENTTSVRTKSYEEYSVPPPGTPDDNTKRVKISTSMPEWTHEAFPFDELNRIQSIVYPIAFGSDENMLVCAPTGAGKTNVALLTILHTIEKFRNSKGELDLDNFKIVYIAPLKALVQEQVAAFSKRLEPYGIRVEELTGDRNMTKQQISETQMIVTTPEKWDVITRKASDVSYTNLVRLVILDEIHLLHDPRGPVLESIVSRALRQTEATGDLTRLVGLSATLPNYQDVASFLRVDKGLFYFDSRYRPCPLLQKFIGITEKKQLKQNQAMDEACYDKVMDYAGKQQVIIFVHSRKETARTARYLRDRALEENTLDRFLPSLSTRDALKQESSEVENSDLQDLLPMGFAMHHAGLSRTDRNAAERGFAEGHVQVLISTATLAWGVNLPAHTVIIKGTQVYSPEKGGWERLSPQDTLQMLGRAGRPQYDKFGEGIIITPYADLDFYMRLMTAQLDIESRLAPKLPDSLNAEIVLGTVGSLAEAVSWMGYSYLFVRMLKSPARYKVGADPDDKLLIRKRSDMVHTAFMQLSRSGLIKYDRNTGAVQSTEMGSISSHFYISHTSMKQYAQVLTPILTPIEVFDIFSRSEEFRFIPVRSEEKGELKRLMENAPIPIRESVDESSAAKVNILLQTFISRLKLNGFVLMADMVYVTQSAGRLLRAMFEICLKKEWAQMARMMLDLCKMVEQRMWLSNTPFRQFPSCPKEVIRKAESSQMPWIRYFDLQDPAEVGQAIRNEKYGRLVYDLLNKFPRLTLNAQFQPITPSLLRVELEIIPEFVWDDKIHGSAESFTVLVEDADGEKLLYSDTFLLRSRYAQTEHVIDFTVPITEPMPPNYFITLVSDRWLHCESRVAISFQSLILPQTFPSHTQMFELEPAPVSRLDKSYQKYFDFEHFNAMQTQTLHALFESDESVFIGTAVGNGKTVCAELALLRYLQTSPDGKAVYISPFQEQIDERVKQWVKFKDVCRVNKLTGELAKDLKILDQSDVILSTPTQWDILGRRWLRRANVRKVGLFICDDMHMIGGLNGYVYEMIILRMKYMAHQLAEDNGYKLRMIGLSTPLTNGKDIGKWIGAKSQTIFNFEPNDRMNTLQSIQLRAFSIPHFPSLMIAMTKPAYLSIADNDPNKSSLIFLHDRRQCVETSQELVQWSLSRTGNDFKNTEEALPHMDRITDKSLLETLETGIGYIYSAMDDTDRKLVLHYYNKGLINVLLATRDTCWTAPAADSVVVMGTQMYEGSQHRYIDYPVNEMLQMVGCAARTKNGKVLILTNAAKRAYYIKFLREALPIESHLDVSLADAFIPDINEGIITSRQDAVDWLTFSYLYTRLQSNPSYYGMVSLSDEGISEYLSKLVEDTLTELNQADLIELEDEEESEQPVSSSNGAAIASYYNILFTTMQTFVQSLNGKSKLKGMLEIVTAATEFETIPMRTHESKLLRKVYDRCPLRLGDPDVGSHRYKAFILAQAHMSRIALPPDFSADQRQLLETLLRLIAACVEVLSSEGHLNAMRAMELSQMVVQAMWDRDSPLKQIPYVTDEVIQRCEKERITSIADFINIEDDDLRLKLLGFEDEEDERLNAVAEFVNSYPVINSLTYEHEEEGAIVAEEPTVMYVTINRDEDDDEEKEFDPTVKCQFYPYPKTESWWLVVGDADQRELYGIKRVTPTKATETFKMSYTVPRRGNYNLTLYCVSDSYLDADREVEFQVQAEGGEEEDEEGDVEMG